MTYCQDCIDWAVVMFYRSQLACLFPAWPSVHVQGGLLVSAWNSWPSESSPEFVSLKILTGFKPICYLQNNTAEFEDTTAITTCEYSYFTELL